MRFVERENMRATGPEVCEVSLLLECRQGGAGGCIRWNRAGCIEMNDAWLGTAIAHVARGSVGYGSRGREVAIESRIAARRRLGGNRPALPGICKRESAFLVWRRSNRLVHQDSSVTICHSTHATQRIERGRITIGIGDPV